MNKQELIEKYEETDNFSEMVKVRYVIEDLKQLDEPQKPIVPQFVADWYEENKDNLEFNIFDYVYRFDQNAGFDFKDWFDDFNTKPFQTLVNMHQFGYEVEKEKRYFVKLKNIDDYLNTTETGFHFYNKWRNNETFTRKELEQAGFGWVFDCPGIEIEEVEG